MKYKHGDGTIHLAATCIATFEGHRQRTHFQREIGGQLFARFTEGAVIIEQATCVKGTRSRFSFHPHRGEEQREINALFELGLHYVGDWHTHPEDSPTPSSADMTKMLEIFQQSKHELPYMLMAIVGVEPFPDGLFLGAVELNRIINLTCDD